MWFGVKGMGLQTDIVFVKALRGNAELMDRLPAKDVYNTSVPVPEEGLENEPLPYVVVYFSGMQNDAHTKDDDYEGEVDRVQVGVEIVARTRPELAELALAVRKTVHDYMLGGHEMEEFDVVPLDYTFSASEVRYDPMKPCYWQTLQYNCETENEIC